VRLRLSRQRGFSLQAHSHDVNGLPAKACCRPGLFGNPFKVSEATPAKQAVTTFRRFLTRWSDKAVYSGIRYEDGEPAPMAGLGMIVLRNRIRANIHHLRGHNLACHCSLLDPCHVDVYLDLLATDWPERWQTKYPKLITGAKTWPC
jgi:hypothetical protein